MEYVLNVLRGAYVKMPTPMKNILTVGVSFLPPEWLYGRTYRKQRIIIEKSKFDATFVNTYQESMLNKLLTFCSQRSDYYRDITRMVMDERAWQGHFTLEDLKKFPIIDKSIVRKHCREMLVIKEEKLEKVSTSGSSGVPLEIFLDKDRSVKEWSYIQHCWSTIGYRPEAKRAVFRGIFINRARTQPWEYDRGLRELRFSPFHMTEENMTLYLELIDKHRIQYIHGYPSAIFQLANYALKATWNPVLPIKGIFPISEPLYPHQRDLIAISFNTPRIVSYYGMSEKVAFAIEDVENPGVYEFEPTYGYVELIDRDGKSVTEIGARGAIIATGFLSFGMPLLRYDTGDMAELVEAASHDNCYRLRVQNISSRWGQEYVVGKEGELISMTALNVHSSAYAYIKAFQLFQEKPGEVIVRVVSVKGATTKNIASLAEEFEKKTAGNIRFSTQECDSLDQNTRGKSRFVEQKISIGTMSRLTVK